MTVHTAPLGCAEAWLGIAWRSGRQLRAHTPPVLSKRAGRWSDRAVEPGTPWCSSPLLSLPQVQNKMAFNLWDNPTSPDLSQPRQNIHPWNTFTLQNKSSVIAPLIELTVNRESIVSLWTLYDFWSTAVGLETILAFALQRYTGCLSVHATFKDRASIIPPIFIFKCTCGIPQLALHHYFLVSPQPFFQKRADTDLSQMVRVKGILGTRKWLDK